ncbi:MAG: DEAD/DEAH box helicase [Verrucomicrobiales bacterium]|nr:DEAD/DEAH box helicase [Verrucomicrobiales bacterium]MCP5526158.1 DEAD/DEAH box helicase [Verrucomicrobiales bacterium]
MSFDTLELSGAVRQAVQALGFETPTPIQTEAIPLMLAGRDVIGSAQTGTGKTAAFGLPILTRLAEPADGPRALILEPTRELAAQVHSALVEMARFTKLETAVVYGGVGYARQNDALRRGVDILVATPGRLLDHMERGHCRLDRVAHLVLDEADRMLDMGFMPDVRRIVRRCPARRQTALFSATIPFEIENLIKWAMRKPVTIEIGARRSPAETVRHALYPVATAQKNDLLLALLEQLHWESVIVFCRTKRGADLVAHLLKKGGHAVAVLHSSRTQSEREHALQGFRKGRYEVLVATDIASRGLDIQDVTHVINYDVPQHPEDYVHRIGRTGRAQAEGDALTLMTVEDVSHVRAVEGYISRQIDRARLDGFDYLYTTLLDTSRPATGGRRSRRARGGRVGRGFRFSPG